MLFLLPLGRAGLAQVAGAAPKVYRLYVDSFGNKLDADELKKELMKELRHSKDVDLVNSAAAATVVLGGDAEIYIRGYVSLYARAGTSPEHGNPVYSGYASAELKNSSGETLWSYLSTVPEGSKDAARGVSKDIVRHLLAALPGSVDKK